MGPESQKREAGLLGVFYVGIRIAANIKERVLVRCAVLFRSKVIVLQAVAAVMLIHVNEEVTRHATIDDSVTVRFISRIKSLM